MNRPEINNRNRHYKLLQVGKRDLGMADEDYRELLRRHGAKLKDGKYSASTMSIGELMQAVAEMKKKGFKPKRTPNAEEQKNPNWREPQIQMIRAIWLELHFAGVVRSKHDVAMQRWCTRVTGKAKMEWCTAADLSKCIEGLKSWAKREGLMK